MGGGKKDKAKQKQTPFVSVCTPTFNRRPFIPIIIRCFENQTYPRERMEWIIVDDGTDSIEDLVAHLPYVRYFRFETKMTLGQKRNFTNDQAKGDILVYMDDDDYYPPCRVKHAVEKLTGCKALCAGSSAMFIHFKHIDTTYLFGPYGPNHATAATFAFKRELLSQTRFDESAAVAEEKMFLKNYTIPFVQLEATKSIVVFSHNQNSFDKKELLKQMPNPNIHETVMRPSDLVKEADVLQFFMHDIDAALAQYEPGNVEHKADVRLQLEQLKIDRMNRAQEEMKKQADYQNALQKIMAHNSSSAAVSARPPATMEEMIAMVERLSQENTMLREKLAHADAKLRDIIQRSIAARQQQTIVMNPTGNRHNLIKKKEKMQLRYPFSECIDKINWSSLSQNSNARSMLDQHLDKVDWAALSKQPYAVPLLEQNLDKVNWAALSENPNAISLLELNLDKVDWSFLSLNPNAIHLLKQHLDKVIWPFLSQNPNAISLLEQNIYKVFWSPLSVNPNAISLLEQNIHNVNWSYLSLNPNAIHLLEKNLDKVDWSYLSLNPNAIHLLEQHLDKVIWPFLSLNPNAIHLLEQHLDKVDWSELSKNPNAIHLLEQHLDKVDWTTIWTNPAIFEEIPLYLLK